MIPNIHQSIDEIIKNASAVEKILWQQVRLLTGENASIRQLAFFGTNVTAIDFSTFETGKLFLCLEMECSYSAGVDNAFTDLVLYSPTNVVSFRYNNWRPVWDTTAALVKAAQSHIKVTNQIFGRIDLNGNSYFKFIGYKIF